MSPYPHIRRCALVTLRRIGLVILLPALLHVSACDNTPTDPAVGFTGWDSVASGTSDMLSDVQFIDREQGWIACMVSDTILRTTDGGASWTRHSTRAPGRVGYGIVDICFTDRLNGWALGYWGGELLHTNDGGVSWTLAPADSLSLYGAGGLCFIDHDHGWFRAGIPAMIISTTDGGLTWHRRMFDGYEGIKATISFTSRWNGWVSGLYRTSDDSTSLLLHTTDGGATWDSTVMHERLGRVQFTDSTNGWIMASGSTILRTTDGGASWTRHGFTTSTHGLDIYFVDRSTGWLTMSLPDVMTGGGEYDVLMRTTDAGEHWAPAARKVKLVGMTEINGISFSDPLNGWAVGSNGVIWHTTSGGVAP